MCLQSLAYRKVTMDYSYYQSSKAQKLNQFDQPKLVRFNLSKLVKVHQVAPVFQLQDNHPGQVSLPLHFIRSTQPFTPQRSLITPEF